MKKEPEETITFWSRITKKPRKGDRLRLYTDTETFNIVVTGWYNNKPEVIQMTHEEEKEFRLKIADEIRLLMCSPPQFDMFGLDAKGMWVSIIGYVANRVSGIRESDEENK